MTSDTDKPDKAARRRAKDIRARIDALTGKEKAGAAAEKKVVPAKESPRDFIARRMSELDKS